MPHATGVYCPGMATRRERMADRANQLSRIIRTNHGSDIEELFLFGSLVHGRKKKPRDIDIGIVFRPFSLAADAVRETLRRIAPDSRFHGYRIHVIEHPKGSLTTPQNAIEDVINRTRKTFWKNS